MPGANPSIFSKSIMILSRRGLSCVDKRKSPLAFAGGLAGLSRIFCALLQAIAVRRHGVSMMMVMAVMVEALHLSVTLRWDRGACQLIWPALPNLQTTAEAVRLLDPHQALLPSRKQSSPQMCRSSQPLLRAPYHPPAHRPA